MGSAVYISDEMSAAVGSELSRQVSFPIAGSDIRRWALAIYYPEPPPKLFWDEEYASTTSHGGIVAPEDFNPFAWMVADPPGHRTGFAAGSKSIEAQLGLAEVGTEFMLNGGADIEYGVRMRPGDTITSSTELAGFEEREGRLGTMLFTRTGNSWVNQDSELVKTTTSTLIRY